MFHSFVLYSYHKIALTVDNIDRLVQRKYWWLSAMVWYIHSGDTAVLHSAIDMILFLTHLNEDSFVLIYQCYVLDIHLIRGSKEIMV